MKTKMLFLAILVSSLAARASEIEITSLASNGRLTWNSSFTNGLFSIEWSPALPATWRQNWNPLEAFWVSTLTNSVEVPMFYRVKCATNLFWPFPLNAKFVFGVSNAVGNVWTQQLHMLGYVNPLAGGTNMFAAMEVVDPHGMNVHLARSTDSAVSAIDQDTLAEEVAFQRAPVGTMWTNLDYPDPIEWAKVCKVEAIEAVTVPAGTFDACYKFHKWQGSITNNHFYEWIKPGFGLVKWIDYWVDPAEYPPIVYQLQSWSITAP